MADHTKASGHTKLRTQDTCEPEETSRAEEGSATNPLEQRPIAEYQPVVFEVLTAVELAMEGISKLDDAGRYVYVNQQYAALLGYRQDELVGQSWEMTVHPDDRSSVLTAFVEMLEIGKAEAELRGVKKDGSVICKHVVLVKQDGSGKRMPGHFCFAWDVTERKREEALQTAEKRTLELVAKGIPLNEVLSALCRDIEAHTKPMLCSIMLVSEDETTLVFGAGPSLPEAYTRLLNGIPIGPAVGSCGSAAYHGTRIIAEDITVHPFWESCAHVVLPHGLRACWSQPIKGSTGRVLGTFAAYYRQPRVPQQADLRLVERVSSIAALAIEHVSMMEAIKESEARFDAFMRHSPAVTFIKDGAGRYVYMNPQFETLASLSRQEAERKTVFDFLPADIATRLSQNDKTVLASGQTRESEESLPAPDGTVRDWLTIKFPLEVGQRPLLGGIAVDITERKRLERANQDQTDRLRLAMDIARLATWDWNILTNQVICSENCEAVKGLPHGLFDGTFDAYQRLVHPEDLPRLLVDIEGALSGRQPYRTEHRIVPPTGEVQWVEGNGVVYWDELGRPIRMVGTVKNITEQKRMEQALRVNEERYARATAVGKVGVWELDVQAGTYYGDKTLKALVGYQPDELSADPLVWLNLVHPDDQSIAMAQWQRIVSREADEYNYELRMIRKDGTVIWTDIRGHAVCGADGQVTHLIGATHDITDRKQDEENLLRTKFAMDQAVDAVYWIDPQAKILYTNTAASAMLGYTADEFLRMTVHDLNPDFPADVWPGFWVETREKKVVSLETVHLTKEGRRIPIDIRVSFLAYGGQEFHCAFVRDISKRKGVEEAAHRSLTLLQSVLHTTPIRVFWKDRESRFLGCNQNFAADAGCADAQEIVGKTDDDLIWHKQAGLYQADDRLVMESGLAKLDFDEPGTTLEGTPICLRTSKVPLRDERGDVIGVLGVYEDITERKRLDEALRESQERFELAVSVTYDGIWDWNILTGEQYWSDHHLELFGLRPGDLTPTYDLWLSLVHPDDAELVRQTTRRHLDIRTPYDIEVRVRMKDGSYRWFRDRGQAVWDVSGRPIRMVGSISDVTERRQAEEAIWRANAELEQRVTERTKQLATANRALEEEIVERKRVEAQLREQERQLNDAQTIAHLGSWELDVTANRLKWSGETCRIFGLTPQEFGETYEAFLDRVHSDDRAMVADAYSRSLRSECGVYEIEHRIVVQGTGEIRVVHEKCIHMRDESGKVIKSVGMVHDVTARKHAEEAIRESELRYKLVTEATFDAIALHDNGVLLEVNAGLERMFGYESGELLGRSILDLVADESRNQIALNMRDGVTGPYEAVGRRKDGTTFPGEIVVRPYSYRGKEVRLVAGRDITLRKQLELQLARHAEELERQVEERTSEIAKLEAQRAQTEKLAAVGQMAAAVAHEINNPIAGIRNAFMLVKQAVDPIHPHYEFVEMIDREISRVASIVQNMYQLYRKEPSKAEPVNLPLLLRDVEALFAKRLSQLGQTLVVTQAPLRSRLMVSQSDLLQVLMNLIQNGIDSSFEGGTITLNVRQDTDLVRISVSDEGSGIPPDVLPHIFDPFFTTKTEKGQKGMGLGLSVSQSLVMAMGGRMEVQTEQGAGSTFSIILPEPAAGSQLSDHRNIIQEVLTHET